MEITKGLDLPLYKPWKYDPLFVIGQEKESKFPNPQDHDPMPDTKRLANKVSVGGFAVLWKQIKL